jgi:hypothetical protein
MKREELKVPASEVREGDFLPGLDNGYVFQDPEENNGYLSYPTTGYGIATAMPEDTLLISFHTAEGEEAYLLVPSDMPLTVERRDYI